MATFHVDDLKLALQYDLVFRIVIADETVVDAEDALLERLCPPETLRAAGFQNEHGHPTERLAEAVLEASRELPKLPFDDKRVLLDECINACVVDGALDAREVVELRRSAQVLGLTGEEFDRVLDEHPAVAVVDPGEPLRE